MPVDAESRNDSAGAAGRVGAAAARRSKRSAPNSPRMAEMVNAFPQLSALASKVSTRVSAQIDQELSGLQDATQLAQRNLFWETTAAHPLDARGGGRFHLSVRPTDSRHRPRHQ